MASDGRFEGCAGSLDQAFEAWRDHAAASKLELTVAVPTDKDFPVHDRFFAFARHVTSDLRAILDEGRSPSLEVGETICASGKGVDGFSGGQHVTLARLAGSSWARVREGMKCVEWQVRSATSPTP